MIRTVKEYLNSLRDGRVIYCSGERVKDVTTHPILRTVVQIGAMDYYLSNDPKYRDLFVSKNEAGEDINFFYVAPKTAKDLVRRREMFVEAARIALGGGAVLHSMGVDGLDAAHLVAQRMDKQLGTHYAERVENYRKYVQKGDLGITGAMTDVKGNRSLRPSKQEQHKDYFVRVVERKKDGIIVRGAKIHISATPCANEVVVVPCRAHNEEDKDYAVSFAVPLNAKGITLISADPINREPAEEAAWNWPVTSTQKPSECIIVFDDVFVPWERVFMCGEWQFSRDLVYAFASFLRLAAVARKSVQLEILTGVASLMAEYNGLDQYSHIRDKLSWLAWYKESFEIIGKASCDYPDKQPGSDIVIPNILYANSAKFLFASFYNEAMKNVYDITGGILTTGPNYLDWSNPEIRPWLEKYLSAKAGIPTEHRLRAIRLIKDVTGFTHLADVIHADGSLAAQRIALFSSADWERYRAAAKRAARIPGWEKHPYIGTLPEFPNVLTKDFPPAETPPKK